MSGGGAEREGDTKSKVGSRLWAVSTEPAAGLELTNHEIMTWAKVGHSTDWATQAPQWLYVFKLCILKMIIVANIYWELALAELMLKSLCDWLYLIPMTTPLGRYHCYSISQMRKLRHKYVKLTCQCHQISKRQSQHVNSSRLFQEL